MSLNDNPTFKAIKVRVCMYMREKRERERESAKGENALTKERDRE